MVASSARIEELELHQKQFDRLLRQAIAEGNGEVIFRLKATMIRAASMIEAYRIDTLIAGDMVRRFETQRMEIAFASDSFVKTSKNFLDLATIYEMHGSKAFSVFSRTGVLS